MRILNQSALYQTLLWLLTPVLLWKTRKQDPARWQERLARYNNIALPQQPIWIHAASLGEAKAACLLIQALRDQGYNGHFVATTTTATGANEISKALLTGDIHLYAPSDLGPVVKRALDQIQPILLLVMEVEIWPNLWSACSQRQIPICLANARLSERSLRRYQKLFAGLMTQTLARAARVLPENESVAARFQSLGVSSKAIQIAGNLKYSLQIPEQVRQQGQQLRQHLGADRPIWLAASTHEGEEEIALNCQQQILSQHPDALLVLVPRHPQRFDRAASLCQQHGLRSQRRSTDTTPVRPETQVYLADSLGELLPLYCAADMAWVAGSFCDVGGHNILEPAACLCPILVGPDMKNFLSICEEFIQQQALLQATTPEQLSQQLCQLIRNPEQGRSMSRTAAELTRPYQDASEVQARATLELLATSASATP
ncbi:MAG: 3-deoxy-D-manno-octulosonic acid transferase [Motiliproteus sp.]